MADSRAYLTTAADMLASAMDQTRAWPADLAESAPHWAALMEQLGEVTRWVVQGAVLVIENAGQLPPDQGRPLSTAAARLMLALNAVTADRVVVDRKWQTIAATFTQARDAVPAQKRQRETQVAGVVHDAADAVRKAANQRLAPADLTPTLHAAATVCEAMCGLVMRISVALDKHTDDQTDLAGIARALRRTVHHPYRDAGEQFTAAALLAEQITTRWPDRWPTSL